MLQLVEGSADEAQQTVIDFAVAFAAIALPGAGLILIGLRLANEKALMQVEANASF